MAARDRSGVGTTAVPAPPGGRLHALRLSRRAKRGETAAFEEIFRSHHQELYRYCLAILCNRDDAEDALQATMAAALRSLPGEQREIDVRPWLFRVAHNESITLLRKRRDGVETELDAADPSASQEAELATRERLRSLVADLGRIPDRQRSAIVMRELSGLSYGEIGSALSCSEGGARQAVFEARTALRDREEGREMDCDLVRRTISDRDGRRLRSRKMRAHLEGCDGCRGFAASISQRRLDLQSLCPPLPAAAAAGMLSGLAGVGGAAAGGATSGVAGAAGGGIAASAAVKGASLAAAVALAAGAADVGGIIDLPDPLGGGKAGSRAVDSASGNGSPAPADTAPPAQDVSSRSDGGQPAASDSSGGGHVGGGTQNADGSTRGSQAGGSGIVVGGGGGQGHSVGTPDAPPGSGGSSSSSPGQTGANPGGGTATAPGQTGTAGNSASAPGHTGTPGGGSASAPGQTGSTPAATGTAGASSSTTNNGNGGLKGNSDGVNGNGSK